MAILRKQIHCQYDTDLATYELFSKVSNAPKHQMLIAVEPTFPQALAHPRWGFLTVTPLVMICHLDETYGRLIRTQPNAGYVRDLRTSQFYH
jgi:hypothetical protein